MATVIDPVCGMTIDEASAVATTIYDGECYFFCAESCKERFDSDPEPYLHDRR